MNDPRDLEFLKNYKPSIDDLKMNTPVYEPHHIYYPKAFVDWLLTLVKPMWNNSEKAYNYWLTNIKDKK